MKRQLALLTLSIMGFAVAQANAAPIFFSNRALFNTAAGGGLNFESFEDTAQASGWASVTYGALNFVETGGSINFFTHTFINSMFTAATTDGSHSIWYDDNGSSVSTLMISSVTPITAFGLDIATSTSSTVTIGGDINSSIVLSANTPGFFGVIDTTPFSSISFSASGGPNTGFDAVAFSSGPVVPEPSSLALFGIGAVGLAFGRRLRKEKGKE